jgi:NAD(P)-dependent dehydrogenase (short-subunit alcohol dehydrogenase family)
VANILITGASDGLGRALAREPAAAGHHLVVHGRDAGRLAGIARETGAVAIRADLSSLDEVRALAARAAEQAPGIAHTFYRHAEGADVERTASELSSPGDRRCRRDLAARLWRPRLGQGVLRGCSDVSGRGRISRADRG